MSDWQFQFLIVFGLVMKARSAITAIGIRRRARAVDVFAKLGQGPLDRKGKRGAFYALEPDP